MAAAKRSVEGHLLYVANIECAVCPVSGCKVTLGTLDENWTFYTECIGITEFAVAEYTGAFTVGCSTCP